MTTSAYDALDGPLYALVRRDAPDGALAPLTVRDAQGGRALPLFATHAAAEAHRAALPAGAGAAFASYAVAARDGRAKEELLRAAAAAHATRLEWNPDLHLRPEATLDLDLAIGHVVAAKTARACL